MVLTRQQLSEQEQPMCEVEDRLPHSWTRTKIAGQVSLRFRVEVNKRVQVPAPQREPDLLLCLPVEYFAFTVVSQALVV